MLRFRSGDLTQQVHEKLDRSEIEDMRRNNSFDAIRLLGAMLVIVGHSFVLPGGTMPTLAGFPMDRLGVKIFFVISGFLITASYLRDSDLRRFAIRRALRIMPALIAVVLSTVLVFALFTTQPNSYAAGAIVYAIRNIALLPYHSLPGVFTDNPYDAVNGSLWTLPVEVFMYAMTPLFILAPRSLLALLAVALIAFPITGSVAGFGLAGAFDVIPYFLMGAFAQLSRMALRPWACVASTAALLLAEIVDLPQILVAVPLTVLVLYVGQSPWLRGLPADISYGMYLIAYPVQQILISAFGLSPVPLIVATVAIVAPLALLSWKLIESPALRFTPKTIRTAPV